MSTKNAILDCDLFLHYVPVSEIDWLGQMSCQSLVLFVAPTLIGELNDKKDASGSAKLRRRATMAIKQLDEYFRQPRPLMIQNNVELRFIPNEPQIDFADHALSKNVKDDWLIASAIELKSALASEESLFLVTNDLGLKMKAGPRGIEYVELADKYKLPSEDDPADKRIKELENQIRQLSSRMPILKLTFQNDADHLEFVLHRPQKRPEDLIAEKMTELRSKYPKLASELKTPSPFGLDSVDPDRIAAYNRELDGYFINFEKYLLDLEPLFQRALRRAKIELKFVNDGTSPATDIDIEVHIPDGMEVLSEEDRLPTPPEPRPPERPQTPLEAMQELQSRIAGTRLFAPNLHLPYDVIQRVALGPSNV